MEITKQNTMIAELRAACGAKEVLTDPVKNHYYRRGWRYGNGAALAVVRPQNLLQLWQSLKICHQNDVIILMQAANTGLTGGSTPDGDDYDRPVVIINNLALSDTILLNEGAEVISFPGTTLTQLENTLAPLNREPHSVIGSTCVGASVIGGVCNNSGGALIKRGPAYTEMALYAQINADNQLSLINELGIDLGDEPEGIIARLTEQSFDKHHPANGANYADDYVSRLKDLEADSPARYNADPSRLSGASGCAGKLAVLAVRTATFEKPKTSQVFYLGSNSPQAFTRIRRLIIQDLPNLPESGEYIHRDLFHCAKHFGRDIFLWVKYFGADKIPMLFRWKNRVDGILNRYHFTKAWSDKFLHQLTRLVPNHLPKLMEDYHQRYEHHLMIKIGDEGISALSELLQRDRVEHDDFEWAAMNQSDGEAAMLHRFVVAPAILREGALLGTEKHRMLSLDVALPRNDLHWFDAVPHELKDCFAKAYQCAHFFCHVMHWEYVLKPGTDVQAVKERMLAWFDERGAKFPAEHNVGHQYQAPDTLQSFYQTLDPTNSFNAGVGRMSKNKRYA